MQSHELNYVPCNLVSPKKKSREIHLTAENLWRRDFLSFALLDQTLLSSFRLDQRIECADSACGRSFYDDSLEEQRTFSQFPQFCSLSRARVGDRDRSVCARTRRQTDDEGWETRHPSCQPMCECRAHDLYPSLSRQCLACAGIPTLFRRLI